MQTDYLVQWRWKHRLCSCSRGISRMTTSVWYLLGGRGVTCPRGVVAGVGGFRSAAASAAELLPDDWGV